MVNQQLLFGVLCTKVINLLKWIWLGKTLRPTFWRLSIKSIRRFLHRAAACLFLSRRLALFSLSSCDRSNWSWNQNSLDKLYFVVVSRIASIAGIAGVVLRHLICANSPNCATATSKEEGRITCPRRVTNFDDKHEELRVKRLSLNVHTDCCVGWLHIDWFMAAVHRRGWLPTPEHSRSLRSLGGRSVLGFSLKFGLLAHLILDFSWSSAPLSSWRLWASAISTHSKISSRSGHEGLKWKLGGYT